MGKARSFSDTDSEAVYQTEANNENYSLGSQQNAQGLGGGVFNDSSGYGNFSQSGSDQSKADLKGALFRGNIGFKLQSAFLDFGTDTIDLLVDQSNDPVSQVSTDRSVIISGINTTADLVTILGAQRPGQRLFLYNTFGNTITIKNTVSATENTILTPDAGDLVLSGNGVVELVYDDILTKWRVVGNVGGGGTGTGTGTFVSADLTVDQITNLAINDHVEFDRNTPPTGADGEIVLQTGAGQANGIFELKSGVTYFLSAAVAPFFGAANDIDLVWFDITNATELGRRTRFSDAVLAMNQPKAEIIFTPSTDVTVEFRLVAATTPANLNGYDAEHTFASIFEFSGQAGAPGQDAAPTWKLPARSKSVADVSNLAAFTVFNDGVTLVEDDRVLLTEQVTLSENGLYQVGVVAGGLAPLTRPTDFDTDAEVLSETFVAIEEGAQFANQLYHLTSNNPLLIDSSDQVWDRFAPGTSGSPDLGGGEDGIDGAGQFVNDGRISTANFITQLWESFSSANLPTGGIGQILWIPALGEDAGRLFATGAPGGPGVITAAFSDDLAETWTASSVGNNNSMGLAAYDDTGRVPRAAGSNEGILMIALTSGTTNTGGNLRRSTDRGENFGIITSPNTDLHRDLIFAQPTASAGQFVITNVSTGSPPPAQIRGIWTSPDGSTWTIRVTPAPIAFNEQWSFLAYSPSLNLYVAVTLGSVGLLDIMTSSDAITWTLFASNIVLSPVQALIWSEGQQKFVMITRGNNGDDIFSNTSPDGLIWEQHLVATSESTDNIAANDVVYAENLSTYVICGSRTTTGFRFTKFWVSQDAETWTEIARQPFFTTTAQLNSIVFAPEYTKFFASEVSNQNVWRTTR